jgi:Protein of unknown function (DUF2857)
MTIKLNNEPILTLSLMGYLLQEIQRGNIDSLLAQGISGSVIDQLRALNAQQMVVLCESKKPLFGISICAETIASTLNNIDAIQSQVDLQSYFITNGATLNMMREYFKVSRTYAQQMRTTLCEESALDMRLPTDDEEQEILSTWLRLRDIQRECERYKALHIELNARYSLRALHRVITFSRQANTLNRLSMRASKIRRIPMTTTRTQEQRL